MIEVLIAITVIAVSALSALSTTTTVSMTEDDISNRRAALRQAERLIEKVLAEDYGTNIQNLLDRWAAPEDRTFSIEGFSSPNTIPAGTPPFEGGLGTVVLDPTDPDRITVTATIRWNGRGADRAVSLNTTITEILR